jgi:hypothetical protein
MNLKQKIDDFAKGREEIRLFLYIILLPILLPYQLIEFIREVRPERTWKETFLWFFAYFGSYSLGSFLILVLFPDLADKFINKHFLPMDPDLST